jgi:L-seryl-tRNA(Ser) seleniumtransferase
MFLHDLGSGLVNPLPGWNEADPTVRATVADGADIVTFSGDKLLGGPQAGLIAGRESLIDRISKHPLMRAVRVDKMTLAALEATLAAYARGDPGILPLPKMATLPARDVEARARVLAAAMPPLSGSIEVTRCLSVMGGGSLPGAEIESWGVALSHPSRSSDEIERSLRHALPPIIARIEDDKVILDLRTVADTQDEHLASCIASVLV